MALKLAGFNFGRTKISFSLKKIFSKLQKALRMMNICNPTYLMPKGGNFLLIGFQSFLVLISN